MVTEKLLTSLDSDLSLLLKNGQEDGDTGRPGTGVAGERDNSVRTGLPGPRAM